jgi:hypothetical protein
VRGFVRACVRAFVRACVRACVHTPAAEAGARRGGRGAGAHGAASGGGQAIIDTAAHFGVAVTGADINAAKAAGGANNDWALTHRLVHDGNGGDSSGAPSLEEVTQAFEARYQGAGGAPGLKALERLLPSKQVLRSPGSRAASVACMPSHTVSLQPFLQASRP